MRAGAREASGGDQRYIPRGDVAGWLRCTMFTSHQGNPHPLAHCLQPLVHAPLRGVVQQQPPRVLHHRQVGALGVPRQRQHVVVRADGAGHLQTGRGEGAEKVRLLHSADVE